MTDSSTSSTTLPDRVPSFSRRPSAPHHEQRAALAAAIPRRPRVAWWLGLLLAIGFALVVLPSITADRWLMQRAVTAGVPAPITLRVAPFASAGGGILVARGATPSIDEAAAANRLLDERPHGALPYVLYFLVALVLAAITTHHLRRSVRGRLVRVQVASFAAIAVLAIAVKVLLLVTTVSVLLVPVAALALVPTLTLDRVVGLATGVLAALIVALVGPFDVGVALLLLVQVAVAGLVVAEGPKHRTRHALYAGACTTAATAVTYPLFLYLTLGRAPLAELADPLHSPWLAAIAGAALATLLAVVLAPVYQLLVGEITHHKLIELEDLSNPLLRQIAERAPGTWQHSLMMANLAEIAANAIGANGRLVRTGAYYHDLGKSLQPKYFIENLEAGETSPHEQLPPDVSCDAIFAHVTDGIATARRAGLHERIIDFMHMHHGNGVLEYFWAKALEQGNPHGLTIENFRYPGHPPQSRETAILAICDAVEAASRTLKKPDAAAIDSLVQRIVYGKLHLGQLDESGLSMSDLRRIADSLRETIRHANHGRIEYPWQKAEQTASDTPAPAITPLPTPVTATTMEPRLDSLDRPAKPEVATSLERKITTADALADTAALRPKPAPQPQPARIVAQRKSEERVTTPFERTSKGIRQPVDRVTQPFERKPEHPTTPFERSRTGGLAAVQPEVIEPRPVEPQVIELDTLTPPPREPMPAPEPEPEPAAPPPEPPEPLDAPFELVPAARKRAATLPPIAPPRRAPTVPPPLAPVRRTPSPEIAAPPPDWARRLAARIDAEIDSDFGGETPVVAPTKAQLQALIGPPLDVTKQQNLAELERLRANSEVGELELLRKRIDPTHELSSSDLMALARPAKPPPRKVLHTEEVDPDDIESAIEVAPPARRPGHTAIGVAKKKPES